MRIGSLMFRAVPLAIAAVLIVDVSLAQDPPKRVALKDGESIELGSVYWVANCRSTMIGLPSLEILEGPPELALTVKEAQVLPRRRGCANKVPGGTLMLKASGVKESKEAKLTFRVKYKTRDGERQTSSTYIVSLFPGQAR
jgi:hypothetical protein